jgi:hypothetical protein
MPGTEFSALDEETDELAAELPPPKRDDIDPDADWPLALVEHCPPPVVDGDPAGAKCDASPRSCVSPSTPFRYAMWSSTAAALGSPSVM